MNSLKKEQKRGSLNFIVAVILILAFTAAFLPLTKIKAQKDTRTALPVKEEGTKEDGTYYPASIAVTDQPPVNLAEAAERDRSAAPAPLPWNPIPAPKGGRPEKDSTVTVVTPAPGTSDFMPPAPSAQGSSPAPTKTFMGEQLTGGSIPPDTHGAVGTTHVMTVSNDQINVRSREGVLIQRMTLNSFWAGITIKGTVQNPSSFDPKILYDRFNQRFIFCTTFNAQNINSAVGFAVSQTNDPTGAWNRYIVEADSTATASGGLWIDFPTIGFNKNWIVAHYNTFGYGTVGGSYQRSDVFVLDKQAAYAGTLSSISAFQARTSTCTAPFETKLGCGFTMAPSVSEDNVSETLYMLEDWDSINGQLRMSKITGTPSTPVLNVGLQFPQSTENWRFNAGRIGVTGGYVPQRDQSAYAVSTGSRIMANDSRINNVVLRNGSLWTSHHVMVGAAPNLPGTAYNTANPDIKTAVQWWQINPTIETGVSTPPIQRGRIVDPLADNCNSASATSNPAERAGCPGQRGQFFIFASISVNKDNDVLVGFTQSSPLTYPSAAYAIRRASDPANTMRDVVVYRSGASNYNIGAGSGTARQNRWGDYSMSQTDPIDDTDFWTIQEYSPPRTFLAALGGIAAPWATWWARVNPNSTQPSNTGSLLINEFRFRGPAGILDEFIELHNPSSTTPLRVRSSDSSEGWAIARSTDGTTATPFVTVPEGVVIPPLGKYLIGTNPVSGVATNENLYYSLNLHPSQTATNFPTIGSIRAATIDTGYSSANTTTDAIPDNAGIALFNTTTPAAMAAGTRVDSVGVAALAPGLFKEGTGIAGLPTSNLQYSLVRDMISGIPQDTNNNASDFVYVETSGTLSAAGQRLGAPGPQNVDSPLHAGIALQTTGATAFGSGSPALLSGPIDSTVAENQSPNRVRNLTPVPNGSLGTIQFRRSIVNASGRPVTRLRFRIASTSTFPSPPGVADFRFISSSDTTATTSDPAVCGGSPTPCSITVRGVTLEEPPSQPFGGGLNSSALAGVITFSNPLPANGRINVNFVFGVEQTGAFLMENLGGMPLTIIAEALAGDLPLAPTAASVTVSGRVNIPQQLGLTNALVTLTDMQGNARTIPTGKFGTFRFADVLPGETYVVSVTLRGHTFAPQVIEVNEDLTELIFTPTSQRRSGK